MPFRPHPAPRPAPHALLSSWQAAPKFNQPLSFDTSSVKDMSYMFYVRSAHALAPSAFAAGPSARVCMPLVRCRRPTLSRPPAHTSLRIVRPPLLGSPRRRLTSR